MPSTLAEQPPPAAGAPGGDASGPVPLGAARSVGDADVQAALNKLDVNQYNFCLEGAHPRERRDAN